MLKNVSGQKIGAQLVSATDGSAFTGSVTVEVTLDAGTQATGTVGSGACTHEGNGYHTYAPSQAETNGDLAAYTFHGTGTVPVTVQVYTLPTTGVLAPGTLGHTLTLNGSGKVSGVVLTDTVTTYTGNTPQTGDSFARIGAAGAGLTNIDLPDQTMNITGNITGNVSGSVGSVTGAVGSVTGAVGSVTGNVGGNVVGSVGSVAGAVGSVTGNIGGNVTGSVGSLASQAKADVNAEVVDALATDTYAEPGQVAPAATASIVAKLNYLYKAWRNKKTQTASTLSILADDATTVDHKATVSDDGTTTTVGEIATGP